MMHALVCLLLALACSAEAAVSLFFDDRGNLLPGRPGRQAGILSATAARGSVPAGINLPPDASYTFFPVTGKTFSDAVQSAQENAPTARLGWSVGLSFDFDAASEINEEDETTHVALKVRNINIDYAITITLPMLLDNTALNPVEQDLWKGYVRGLVEEKRARIEVMKDPAIREMVEDALNDITYAIFDPVPGMDIDAAVAAFMREEGIKAGREMALETRRRLMEYQKRPSPGTRSRSANSSSSE